MGHQVKFVFLVLRGRSNSRLAINQSIKNVTVTSEMSESGEAHPQQIRGRSGATGSQRGASSKLYHGHSGNAAWPAACDSILSR